jgi:GNAT superfamily N-acetyltransferase
MLITTAVDVDVDSIIKIAHQYRNELGYVHPVALHEHIAKGTVHVCKEDGRIVGFVDFHARRDGWQTVYHLATDKEFVGQSVGRQLLYSVPCPMRLKVTTDNETANRFYANAGMRLVATELGRKRPLNVYELRILGIFCMGNGPGVTFPTVARLSGMAYGTRSSETARAWPYMLDIDWKQFNDGKLTWPDYMAMVNEYRPVQAMCVDYESPEQLPQLKQQVDDLRAAGVMRIMVCPKFPGAVADIPDNCIVAISIPSGYAGFIPDLPELRSRRLHLLGGTPHKQREYTLRFQAVGGTVISFDGNSHQRAAQTGSVFASGKWLRSSVATKYDADDVVGTMVQSGKNWLSMMQATIGYRQESLF